MLKRMKIPLLEFACLLVMLVLFSACSTPNATTPSVAVDVNRAPQEVKQPDWTSEWEGEVSAAKKEGKVVIYSSGIAVDPKIALISGIKKNYGLDAEILLGRGEEISQKIFSERRAGIYMVDVYL